MINLITIGEKVTDLGFSLLPFSFFAYILLRPLGYFWKLTFFKIVKSIWYLASGATMLMQDLRVETVVMFIAFIEAYDLIFQYLEERRESAK